MPKQFFISNSKIPSIMVLIVFLVLLYCVSSVVSIVLLGDKKLIGGNLYQTTKIISLLLNWKFILSMAFAVITRLTFTLLNSAIIKVPYLANAATTITTFLTLISLIFIVVANHFFLNERLNLQQGIGAFFILIGIIIMFK